MSPHCGCSWTFSSCHRILCDKWLQARNTQQHHPDPCKLCCSVTKFGGDLLYNNSIQNTWLLISSDAYYFTIMLLDLPTSNPYYLPYIILLSLSRNVQWLCSLFKEIIIIIIIITAKWLHTFQAELYLDLPSFYSSTQAHRDSSQNQNLTLHSPNFLTNMHILVHVPCSRAVTFFLYFLHLSTFYPSLQV